MNGHRAKIERTTHYGYARHPGERRVAEIWCICTFIARGYGARDSAAMKRARVAFTAHLAEHDALEQGSLL